MLFDNQDVIQNIESNNDGRILVMNNPALERL